MKRSGSSCQAVQTVSQDVRPRQVLSCLGVVGVQEGGGAVLKLPAAVVVSRAGQMRDPRLQDVEAVVQRQERGLAETDGDRLLLGRQHRRASGPGPIGASRRTATAEAGTCTGLDGSANASSAFAALPGATGCRCNVQSRQSSSIPLDNSILFRPPYHLPADTFTIASATLQRT
jgi:hypothetical protein